MALSQTLLALVALAACTAAAPATSASWSTYAKVNACGTPCGNVNTTDPAFHYVGKLKSADECAATCEAATANCSIWIYSSGSTNCWWRRDGVWSPEAASDITSGCRSTPSDGLACVPGCGGCAVPPPPPFNPTNASNMNGEYILSQTPLGKDTQDKFPTHFKDYPRGVEYFEVYSPVISQLYSQVYWKGMDPVPLPADVVKAFDGRGMAIVGFEIDQVRRTPDGDVSVPLDVVYNHHFESNMVGKKAAHEKVTFTGPEDPRLLKLLEESGGHGVPSQEEHWFVRDLAPDNAIPTHQSFGGANGGEYRKSFHGYAPGFAQVIDSPTSFQFTPMQIDTWNRDKMNLTGPTKFVVGPLPRNSLAGPNANYSGLLECPLTTRVQKVIKADYEIQMKDTCPEVVGSSQECFAAATKVLAGVNITTTIISDATRPAGCLVGVVANRVTVSYNTANGTAACAGAGGNLAGISTSLVTVDVALDTASQTANITLTGPADVWFGVGFGAQKMGDNPWALIVQVTGPVTERKLADQSPGAPLSPSVTTVSNTVSGNMRTVVVTRPLKGKSADYYTFDPSKGTTINYINAVGNTPTLSYHRDKAPATLSFLPVVGPTDGGACICNSKPAPFGQGKGFLQYIATNQTADVGSGTVGFGNNCQPQPRTDLLAMRNPTCDVRSYVGGQTACHHMWSLLDADQEIPWTDQPLEYQIKFRFWYQPYNASYHQTVSRTTWGIASPVEYDVPKCYEGIMGCSKDANGDWIHTIHGTYGGGGKLVAAHFHCHAPTCISMAMYRNDTGELICREDPVYGGTGKLDNPKWDEPGYILQPPCLWGDAEFGLQPPPDVNGVTLHTVKTSYANWGHHGEMAWQQMFFV